MLTRKNFIKTTGLISALSIIPGIKAFSQDDLQKAKQIPEKIRPKRLEKGDTIGLVTPAGVITEDQLKETIEKIENFGFKTYYLPSVLSQFGYFAGTEQERVDELMHMFTNTEVDGIWCVRGGYGGIRMLDLVDYELIKQNPKVFIGYSDITALLNSIHKKTGLITFHGPLGISSFNEFSIKALENVMFKSKSKYKLPYKREENTEDNPEFDIYTINEGKVEGELVGGNLSVLSSMTGSIYEVDFKDKIVFLEDVDEKVYSIDRWLSILLNGTNLREAAGIALGAFSNCNKNDEPSFTLKEILEQILKPLNIPISYGLSFGHIASQFTIPVGARAEFNAGKNRIKLLEQAVLEV
ncbi:MAG: LD-carboxypeptidase [Bacteroidales bacterium]|nr:LD-carboxypeptidase [Bacteroidales bacterium]MCF8392210.1 LD-carboxypeptidase [Bacteroidales bacterium]